MRSQLPRLIFSLTVGLLGLGALIALTGRQSLSLYVVLPLAFFILLSFIVKRAGVYAGPDTLHSLVGIVDLAAIFIFGPLPGAWVPALSSLFYVLINVLQRERRTARALLEAPIFNAGLKGLIGLASGSAYRLLGGSFQPLDLNLPNAVPTIAAVLVWFGLDNLGWAIFEWMRLGWQEFYKLFRVSLGYSIFVELIPLPFAMVIAVVYGTFGGITRPIFLLMAAALIEVAFVIQRYADAQARVQRRSRELVALNEFGQAVARAGFDADRVIELLLERARSVASGDTYRLDLLNAERDQVLLTAETRGASGEGVVWTREEHAPAPSVAYLRDNPASLLVHDLTTEMLPFGTSEQVDGKPARAAIYVPLLAGEQVMGVFTVLSGRPRSLGRVAERNLNAMASQAAVALENANLYAIERRRATQLAIVSEVSRRVAQFLDLDELLQQVVMEIRDRFGYSNVHIFAKSEGNELVFRASTHPLGEKWRERRESIPAGRGIVGWVLASGEPLLAPDVTKEPHYIPGPDQALLNTCSELAVPLIVGHQVIGVLDVQSDQVNRFGQEDLFVLRTLAAQIAIAIEDARLYASQKEEAWYLNVMLQVSENLADTVDLGDALETVVRITPILVGVARCAVFLYDAKTQALRAAKAYGLAPELLPHFELLEFKLPSAMPTAFNQMFVTKAPVVIEEVTPSDPVFQEIVRTFQLESMVITPLIYRGQVIGAMVVDQGPRPRRFSEHEIQVLMGISNQAAVAIENARLNEEAELKRRLEYELGLARQIQTSFLPGRPPLVAGYQIAGAWRAAREVSGDFYDFVSLPAGRLGLTIADVSDKGMPAALFMVLTRTLIRAMAIGKPTPQEALERANDLIIADAPTDMFATAFYGTLDPATAQFTFANAGHNPPLWFRREREELTTLKGHGLALGVRPSIHLPEETIELGGGDAILMYTDGITDALNSQEEEFGAARLADLVAANAQLPAQELVDEILRSVYEFSGGTPQFDDMTMVVLKREIDGQGGS
jgi:serine phosphatase RsbU (regulator of sigma subunit)/putative methionine-R-sulfoxide reductase with GAF domain